MSPKEYRLELAPDVEKFSFAGKVEIELEVKQETSQLVLNASELVVSAASVTVAGAKQDGLKATLDQPRELLTVTTATPLKPGTATLSLTFTGTLNDKLKGFYRSKYSHNGAEKHMATTQFESTYARLAFPCWDEPEYKASFDVTLVVPEHLTALSNMDVKKSTSEGARKRVEFNRTPLMSSYLVAFIVGDFSYVETKTAQDIIVRVYTLPGKQEQGHFALECGKKALEFYHGFFGVPYPLPKSDLIAIPDFAMGAMENWGLVTYREVYLLVDEAKSSQAARSHIALIVGHELAHMWFGNLATMRWWTDLWLKEGFATFMEYCFVAETYPQFQIWMQFANDEISRAFNLDALKASHPIEVPIENPNELDEIYDGISYAKSASIIGMLHAHLGRETFRGATSAYLKKFSFANAETADLWAAFSNASGQDVAALMKTWTGRMGFPVVSARLSPDRKLILSQRRFLADGSDEAEGDLWSVPVLVTCASHPDEEPVHKLLLNQKEQTFDLPNVPAGEWIKLNAGMQGYYRVEYEEALLKPLLAAVASKALGPLDRFNLVTDTFALVRAGRKSATVFLDLLAACAGEDNYNVWLELDSGVGTLSNCLARRSDTHAAFLAFVCKTYGPALARLGWEAKPGESYQDSRLRALLILRLGQANDAPTLEKAKAAFDAYNSGGAPLNPDLRSTIFQLVGYGQGKSGFDLLRKHYETSELSEEKRQCLMGMATGKETGVHEAAFKFGLESVRPADLYMIFAGAVSTQAGQEATWAFFKEHYDQLLQLFGGANSNIFIAIVKMASCRHADETKAAEIDAYFKDKPADSAGPLARPVAQSLEAVRLNAAFLSRDADAVNAWLTKA